MKRKRVSTWSTFTCWGVAAGVALSVSVLAQGAGFKRTPLQKTDDPGSQTHEVIQGQADVDPGGSSGMHWHHGLEMGYVISGAIQLERAGKSTTTVRAGEVFLIDPTVTHNATNNGTVPARIVATYVVEKGKPLAENVK